ncbi:M13 family metallopeptidase [Flavobacterium agrisoli]|uniref:M13 family metallopeptidase n=1 Tax=Flavobacterium agrisoli TaxID=2793066 RepID=A0A934PMT8_9FLAO|nr:M13 family metallopeptidase [Flavobacterium agrisoli]MBK0369709.1 M13 family metallopeptidase [Flavobacterium agrisoli]
MKKQTTKQLFYAIPAFLTFGFAHAQNSAASEPGINLSYMNKSVRPQDNFFEFVNGTWLQQTIIPSDQTSWGGFNELRLKTDKNALSLLNEASKSNQYKSNTDQGKAINLYNTILDTVGRNKNGIAPLQPYLKKINAIKNVQDLQKYLVEMEPKGGAGFIGIYVGADSKNSNRNVVSIGPGGLGLPDKDYYNSDDKDSKEKREKYQAHVERMLAFLGEKPAEAKTNAAAILALETAMSAPRLNRVERRDRRKQYNPTAVNDLNKMIPSLDLKSYLANIGMAKIDTVIVSQPRYMEALDVILKENNVSAWKEYLKWQLLNRSSSQLTTAIEDANFAFYGTTLTGAEKKRPSDERALQTVNRTIGEALGKLYVEKYFPAAAKAKAQDMIKNVMAAYKVRINNLTWMSPETKAKAIEKLEKLTVKIAYPDKWEDYSKLEIKSVKEGGSYFENSKNLAQWHFQNDLEDLTKPVDKTKWGMSPQTVNAYFNPAYNEIVFPAAILQPPFYNYQADEAVNYGGIGAVIGHEISHGFDDSGARYNADGNLVDWWTADDLKQFTELGSALADQYSALEPLPGIHVDGKFTLGENIGDLGGVNAAYDGLQMYLKQHGNPGLIDGFTPEQRFFISWATVWRTKSRDEALKNQVKTDPHSPGMFRAVIPIQNMDAFYQAFDIKPGDKMYVAPEKRVKIW